MCTYINNRPLIRQPKKHFCTTGTVIETTWTTVTWLWKGRGGGLGTNETVRIETTAATDTWKSSGSGLGTTEIMYFGTTETGTN